MPHPPAAPRPGADADFFDDDDGFFDASSEDTGEVVDRRSGLDQRSVHAISGVDPDRRRGPGRRLSDFAKAAEEGELTREQFLFVSAIDAYKRANSRTFPSWTEVLEVVRLLGYRKTCPMELRLPSAEDWCESAGAAADVRTIAGDLGGAFGDAEAA